MSLENAAFNWLHWEKKCPFILFERSPREWSCGRPDMLGITKSRYLLEVEIKRSVSDFKANELKRTRRDRRHHLHKQPKKFWYLVPETIEQAVTPFLPPDCGLLVLVDGHSRKVAERVCSPTNNLSQRLTIKECATVVNLMANQMQHLFRTQIPPADQFYVSGDFFYGMEYVI